MSFVCGTAKIATKGSREKHEARDKNMWRLRRKQDAPGGTRLGLEWTRQSRRYEPNHHSSKSSVLYCCLPPFPEFPSHVRLQCKKTLVQNTELCVNTSNAWPPLTGALFLVHPAAGKSIATAVAETKGFPVCSAFHARDARNRSKHFCRQHARDQHDREVSSLRFGLYSSPFGHTAVFVRRADMNTYLSCAHRRPVSTGYVRRERHAAAVKRQSAVAGGATKAAGDGSPHHSSQVERGGQPVSRRVGGHCPSV